MKKEIEHIYLTREQFIELRFQELLRKDLIDSESRETVESWYPEKSWEMLCHYSTKEEYEKYNGSNLLSLWESEGKTFKLAKELFPDAPIEKFVEEYIFL